MLLVTAGTGQPGDPAGHRRDKAAGQGMAGDWGRARGLARIYRAAAA